VSESNPNISAGKAAALGFAALTPTVMALAATPEQ
jgi:hypothetical protein